jgi:glutaredoxin
MTFRLPIVFSLCALALPCAQAQTLYKIVTPDGRVVYTDHPPTQGKVLKTLTPDPAPATALPATAAEQLAKLQSLRAVTAVPTSGVVLYSAAWCGYCTKAKAWLAGRGIAYREVDIDTTDGMASFAQAGGGKGVPLLVANGQRVQGFSPSAYDQLFARK